MAETKFTPGPWEVVSLSGWGSPFSIRMSYVAETAKPNQTHYGVQSIRREEDANLISAAPELLEAAIEALDLLETISPFEGDVVRHLRKAIAKATHPSGGDHGE